MFIVINMFGQIKEEIARFLIERNESYDGMIIDVKERHYETYVSIDTSDEKSETFETLVRDIKGVFSKNIYGTNEHNIYTCAFDLLMKKGKTLAIAESASAGRLCSEFVGNNDGASKVLKEGIVCYTIESKCKRFGIDPEFFDSFSASSIECSKTLAYNLKRYSDADVTIAVTGYASNIPDENNGNTYIALALDSGVYAQRVRFFGSRNHIMQQMSKYAFMFLIKMLNQE